MFCYRFPDEETFMSLAEAVGVVATDEQGHKSVITATHEYCVDVIGAITEGGEYDAETGEVIVPPVILEGFHCNTAGIAPEAWDPYLCIVNHPVRVFAGGATQAPPTDVLEEIAA